MVAYAHRYSHTILVFNQFLILLKESVLEVKTVFLQTFLQVLNEVVKGNINEYGSKKGSCKIEPDNVYCRIEARVHSGLKQQDENKHHEKPPKGVENLTPGIKLNVLLKTCFMSWTGTAAG